MLQFARDNRSYTRPRPTSRRASRPSRFSPATFTNIFNLMYEIEEQLKLLLGLIFNSIVLGLEIVAYPVDSGRSRCSVL